MAEPPPPWPGPPLRVPPGLLPASPPPLPYPSAPPRPIYREPHQVRPGPIAAGAGAAALWLFVFGLLGQSFAGYVWWTLFAGAVAWLVALGLTYFGDRGVATGIAIVTALGWSLAAATVAVAWATRGDWPLW